MAVDAFDYCRMTKGVFTRNEQSNIGFNRYFKRGGRSRLFKVSGEARRRVYDPPFVPTPSERSFVQTMAGARMSADEICKVIGSARGNGRPIAKTTLYRHFGNEMKNGQAMLKALIMGRYRAGLDDGAAWATQIGMRTLFRWDINCALLPPDPAGTTSSIRVEFVKPDPKLIEDDGPAVEHEQRHDEGPRPGQRLLPPPSQQPMPDLSKRNGGAYGVIRALAKPR